MFNLFTHKDKMALYVDFVNLKMAKERDRKKVFGGGGAFRRIMPHITNIYGSRDSRHHLKK